MRMGFLAFAAALLLFPAMGPARQDREPYPPGLRSADQAIRNGSQLEPPAFPQRRLNPVKLESEASELERLATVVHKQVALVGHGELPATLPKNLKEIAKITHTLRLQLSQ